MRLDDWLPSLVRASTWNGWTEEELLIQLAGYMRGRALQEWSLIDESDRGTYASAIEALRGRLDPGSKTLAAQDFRHTLQKEGESVADFIRRLERVFRLAYGRDKMTTETRDTLLYGQLHAGLAYVLMQGPAVSGASDYKTLCVAAKNEERRLAELKKRQQYLQAGASPPTSQSTSSQPTTSQPFKRPPSTKQFTRGSTPRKPTTNPTQGGGDPRACYNCGRTGHLAKDCRAPKKESTGHTDKKPASTKVVQSTPREDPLEYLLSSESDSDEHSEVRQVRVHDQGSKP